MRLFISFFIFSLPLLAVINISPNEVGLRPGLSGNIQAAVNNQRGNTDKDEYDFSAKVNYDNNSSYVTWLAFSYAYGQAAGVENENKAYLHYRFIHTLYSKDWNWEFFAQNQGDDFRQIQRRLLGSVDDYQVPYATDSNDTLRDYAAYQASMEYVYKITETSKFVQYLMYRSEFADTSNYFAKSKTGIEAKVSDIVSLGLAYTVDYTNNKADDVRSYTDRVFIAGLIVDF